MQKLILIIFAILFFYSCKKIDHHTVKPANKAGLLMLSIYYDQPGFEGGKEYALTKIAEQEGIMPLQGVYEQQFEFAYMTYIYTPGKDTVLRYTMEWPGRGGMLVPKSFDPASDFTINRAGYPAPVPTSLCEIEKGEKYADAKDSILPAVWNNISSLSIVKTYTNQGALTAIHLYCPDGFFNPKTARWIVFLYLYEKK